LGKLTDRQSQKGSRGKFFGWSGYQGTSNLRVASGGKCCPCGIHITATDSHDIPACAGCGRCCHQVVELVAGVDHVPEAWVVEHAGRRCLEQRGDGACVALDPVTRLCTIYDSRPTVCRDFDRGGELCRKVLARPARRIGITPKGWLKPVEPLAALQPAPIQT